MHTRNSAHRHPTTHTPHALVPYIDRCRAGRSAHGGASLAADDEPRGHAREQQLAESTRLIAKARAVLTRAPAPTQKASASSYGTGPGQLSPIFDCEHTAGAAAFDAHPSCS